MQLTSRALATISLLLLCVALPGRGRAQTIRVSGRIVDESGVTPIQGAIIRITSSDSTMTTGPSGTFSFSDVIAGPSIITIAAVGRQLRTIPLNLAADTVLTIALQPRVVSLDPMVIRPNLVKIKGTVLDSLTREPVLFAQVSLYPDGRVHSASNIGNFSFDKAMTGPVTLVAEAVGYLPRQIDFTSRRDTTIRLMLAIDSVAVRMIAAQVTRLADRAESQPYTLRVYNSDLIERERRGTLGEVLDRMMLRSYSPGSRAAKSAGDACVFVDDRKVPPGMLDGLYPELYERIEVYRGGAMIRVYSKRYLMTLVGKGLLPKITYIPTGLLPFCE